MTTERPKMPPTDTQIVAAFIAEAETKTDLLSGGEIAARRELSDSLALAKIERAEYVKDAGERIKEACAEVAKGLTAFMARANGVDGPKDNTGDGR